MSGKTARRPRDAARALRHARAFAVQVTDAAHLGTAFTVTCTPESVLRMIRASAPTRWPTVVRYPLAIAVDGRHLEEVEEIVVPYQPAPAEDAPDAAGTPAVWTADHVRGWITEALDTLSRLPGDGPAGPRCALPPVVREAIESYGWQPTRVRQPVTLGESARLDSVLGWLFFLDDVQERRAVVGVALGVPLRRLARDMQLSHTTVSRRESAGIARILARLAAGPGAIDHRGGGA